MNPPRWVARGILLRHGLAACLGLGIAEWILVARLYPTLAHCPEFWRLVHASRFWGLYVLLCYRWSLRAGLPLACLALLNFLEVLGPAKGLARYRGAPGLPPYPEDRTKTQLILGEVHEQDGTRSERPSWAILPGPGMFTGIGVVGATGRGKTSSALYPFLRQLVRLHPDSPSRKFAGLVIDPKGNMADDVRRMCADAGRLDDFYEVKMPSVRMNILHRPDLSATALAGHITDVIRNVQGSASSENPFWESASRELATQSLRVIRLARGHAATMADLYRTSASRQAFERGLEEARVAAKTQDAAAQGELESLEYWYTYTLSGMDERTRANVAATLSGICALFDEPLMRRCFCPVGGDETFLGFDSLIENGKVVVLSLPEAQLKAVARIVSVMTKLNFQDAVLGRLARAQAANADVGRGVFLVADEYDQIVSQPGDGSYLSKCREARACNILAFQSFTSIGAKLHDTQSAAQLLAQLATKVFFGVEDNETADAAARLCGRVFRDKVSRSVGESSSGARWSFVDRQTLAEGSASSSAATTHDTREEYLFPPRVFTTLKRGQTIMKVFDGKTAHEPWVVYTKPIHLDPEESWFDQEERDDEGA